MSDVVDVNGRYPSLFDEDVSPVVDPAHEIEQPLCDAPTATIYRGHALEVLRRLPDTSVHCIVTSPPYWSLRDYKSEPLIWGADAACVHEWLNESHVGMSGGLTKKQMTNTGSYVSRTSHGYCRLCDAWRGALGLEPTPELFIEHLTTIFRECRRVLRDDGVAFVVIADSYSHDTKRGGSSSNKNEVEQGYTRKQRRGSSSVKPKDLVGIPWMLAFALRADGWYLRSDIIWAKGISFIESYSGSTMPESVTDRPTKAHEYVFLLTKSEDYYWDAEAIKERGRIEAGTRAAEGSGTREGNRRGGSATYADSTDEIFRTDGARLADQGGGLAWVPNSDGYVTYDGNRNVRSVWAISPRGFDGEFCTACRRFFDGPTKGEIRVVTRGISGEHSRDSEVATRSGSEGSGPSVEDTDPTAERDIRICQCGRSDAWLSHFATFPDDLVFPMVKAATSNVGCCATCGAPLERIERRVSTDGRSAVTVSSRRMASDANGAPITGQNNPMRGIEDMVSAVNRSNIAHRETVGWQPTCNCAVNRLTPAVVLDPFSGAGTTAMVSLRLSRSFIGAELNRDYADMAAARIRADAPLLNNVSIEDLA